MKKILVVTKNWLGDILFEVPSIHLIREKFPEAEIVCMAPPRCREILERNPDISRVLEFDERGAQKSFWARIQFIRKLRREKFDKAFLFHRSRTRAFLLFLGGVKKRTGFKTKSGFFLTTAVPEPSHDLHHVDYFMELLKADGFQCPAAPSYKFYFSKEDGQRASRILQQHGVSAPYICFHLGANWEHKRWPLEHFAALADLLSQKTKAAVVLTGSRGDGKLARKMLSYTQASHPVDITGRTSLGELAGVFSGASFVVSADSGPMHIASGVGARVMAIFGPTDPKLTGPRGTGDTIVLSHIPEGYTVPWYGKKLPVEGWLSFITPERVMTALEEKGWLRGFSGEHPAFTGPAEAGVDKKGNLLFVTLSNIGDVILTMPALTAAARHYPGASVTVVCGPKAASLLTGSRWVDRLLIYDKKASWKEKLQFLKELRKTRYDCVVDLRNSAMPFLVSAKKRSPVFRRFRSVSMRERHLEVLEKMRLQAETPSVFDFFNAEDERRLLHKLKYKGVRGDKDWIVIAPVAASSVKTWRLEGFREVIRRLLDEQNKDIILVGDSGAVDACRSLIGEDRHRVFSLAGETPLRELAVLVSRSALVLANDSAVMHLAHEMDRAVVSLFGPTNHEKYGRSGPHWRIVREGVKCSPCEAAQCRFERQSCFEDLRSEKVFQACMEVMNTFNGGFEKRYG